MPFINRRTTQRKATQSLVTATTLVEADSGKTFFLNLAGGFTVTLPAPTDGVEYEFIVGTAPTTAYIVNNASGTAGDNVVGHVLSSSGGPEDTEPTNGDSISFVANTAVRGDRVHVISDGTSWYATCRCAAAGGIVITD